MTSYVQRAVNAIIRPPRYLYYPDEIPTSLTGDDSRIFIREPLKITNMRHQTLLGSLYYYPEARPETGGKCLMFLHGNASSQFEGQFLVPNFCPYGIFVFLFDFAGCGASDGEFVSLGFFEMQDTLLILNYLIDKYKFDEFVLWGRSMGAATALLVDHPWVKLKVSDSSFTSVSDMCRAITAKLSLPSIFNSLVIWFLKNQVLNRAGFDFKATSPISCQLTFTPPCVFGHSNDDEFIPFEHCVELHKAYSNPMKYIMALTGGHNAKRGLDWLTLAITIIMKSFNINVPDIKISECRKLQSASFHFSNFDQMVDQHRNPENDIIDVEVAVEALSRANLKNKSKKRKHHKKKKNEGDVADENAQKSDEGGEEKKSRKKKKNGEKKKKNSSSSCNQFKLINGSGSDDSTPMVRKSNTFDNFSVVIEVNDETQMKKFEAEASDDKISGCEGEISDEKDVKIDETGGEKKKKHKKRSDDSSSSQRKRKHRDELHFPAPEKKRRKRSTHQNLLFLNSTEFDSPDLLNIKTRKKKKKSKEGKEEISPVWSREEVLEHEWDESVFDDFDCQFLTLRAQRTLNPSEFQDSSPFLFEQNQNSAGHEERQAVPKIPSFVDAHPDNEELQVCSKKESLKAEGSDVIHDEHSSPFVESASQSEQHDSQCDEHDPITVEPDAIGVNKNSASIEQSSGCPPPS